MNIGVKYCGGCNPTYDRKKFLLRLKEKFNFNFSIAYMDEVYDIILVLCGCKSCCAHHDELRYRLEKILVRSDEDFDEVEKILFKYSDI